MLAGIFSCDVPASVEEKRALVLSHGLALWDTIASCDITGSSDSSIKNVVPTELKRITDNARIERVLCNGALSFSLYERYGESQTGIKAAKLPSTSPANAAWSLERLIETWRGAIIR